MRSWLLALPLAAALATAASAQPYGGYGYDYDRPPPPRYGYGSEYGPPRGYRYAPEPQRFGRMCITARGACPVGRPLPSNTSCGCEIPGFGFKRGAVD